MSCKYCELKRRKDDDVEWAAGEDWESESDDGGYICQHGDGFRMLIYYDARCACTAVDNVKYCPFCGEKLKLAAEPLIKDEKVRKAVRAWAEACGLKYVIYKQASNEFYDPDTRGAFAIKFKLLPVEVYLEDGECYAITELCGEEEE